MKSIIVAIALLLTASTVQALTMDFEAPLFNFGAGNCVGNNEFCRGSYTENGIRMQRTAGHFDFFQPGAGGIGNYLNIDLCCDQGSPIGPNGPVSTVRFDIPGGLITLLSLDIVEVTPPGPGFLISSAGGVSILQPVGHVNFSGPQWTKVAWIDFSTLAGFAGIDNVTVLATPEPSALWLLLMGSLLLTWAKLSKA